MTDRYASNYKEQRAATQGVREMLEFIEVDGVAVSVTYSDGKLILAVSGSKEYVGEIPTSTLLAAAREEERESNKLKVSRSIIAALKSRSSGDGTLKDFNWNVSVFIAEVTAALTPDNH